MTEENVCNGMNLKVYRVIVEACCVAPADYLGLGEWEEAYQDIFPTRREAIRYCQRKFAKTNRNDLVVGVHASVPGLTITSKGVVGGSRIYKQFK